MASSRSACSNGGPHAGLVCGQASLANGVDGRELGLGQPGSAERACRLLADSSSRSSSSAALRSIAEAGLFSS